MSQNWREAYKLGTFEGEVKVAGKINVSLKKKNMFEDSEQFSFKCFMF